MFEHRVGANLRPSDYELGVLPLRHCSLVYDTQLNQPVSFRDFPAVSVVTGSRIFQPYLVVTCRDFPAVSAVTGSRIFRPYQVVTCQDFLAVSAVTCRDFPALPFLAPEGRDFSAVSVVSGRYFPAVAFLAWVI